MEQRYGLDQTFTHTTATHEHTIRWTRFGRTDAPALVFIHGTPWSSVVWQNLASALSDYYSIYLYDHPGFGLSPSPRRLVDPADQDKIDLDGSLSLRAEANAALFKHWQLAKPPHIVAHDNAGLVSLRLLLEHDINFASLCLIDVVAFGKSKLPFFKLVAENQSVFTAIPPTFVEGFVRAYVKTAMHKPITSEIEDLLCRPWFTGGTQGPERFLQEMVQAHHRDPGELEKEYSRVGGLVPTKIIWGGNDTWLPVERAQRLKDALNPEQVVIIEEAGHLIHYDQPGKLALEVGLWLNKHSN